jgi:DNA polymerase II small subunit/DNA polymerase delta subunit B
LKDLSKGQEFAHIHSCKEIENFLINRNAIERAIKERIEDKNRRSNKKVTFAEDTLDLIEKASKDFRNKVFGQLQAKQFEYQKSVNPQLDQSTITEDILEEFDDDWSKLDERIKIIPGKDFLSKLNELLQEKYGISISKASIIKNFKKEDVPSEIKDLINKIEVFRK